MYFSQFKKNKFNSIEKWIFLFIVLLNALPVFWFRFFPTLDGPAHLYNSNLINHLLFNYSDLGSYFSIIWEPVPNWTGHLILSFFNIFLPGFIAEKTLLVIYMFALPIAFREFIKTISPQNKLFSYFIFPFSYSFTFLLGFYNFSIALCFLFFTLNFWLKNQENLASYRVLIKLFLLITATYFSHLFVFAILGILIGLQVLVNGFIQIISNQKEYKNIIRKLFKKTGFLILASGFCILLFVYYFVTRPVSVNFIYMQKSVLFDWLIHFDFLNSVEGLGENYYSKMFFYIIIFLLILAVIGVVKRSFKTEAISFKNSNSHIWLSGSILILFLYFKMPESDDYSGYISSRLALLFYLFLIAWLSAFSYSKKILIPIIIIFLIIHFKINSYYFNNTSYQNKVAESCEKASKYIIPNSVVLPINYSENNLHRHFSNYLGIDKPMIILENYEANTGYFPIKWNENTFPNLLVGNTKYNKDFCLFWKTNTKNLLKKIDYIFILGKIDTEPNDCRNAIKKLILDNYRITYENEHCSLYQLKASE